MAHGAGRRRRAGIAVTMLGLAAGARGRAKRRRKGFRIGYAVYARIGCAVLSTWKARAAAAFSGGAARAKADAASDRLLKRAFSARDKATGWTLLHYAALLNSPDAVATLIEAGADPNARVRVDPEGERASPGRELAARPGLEDSFAGREATGETPAMIAAATNSVAALAELVARGADIDAVNSHDDTPLSMAASTGARDTAIWLVEHGALPGYAAARLKFSDVAKFLVERGFVGFDATDYSGLTPSERGGNPLGLVLLKDPLHAAVFMNAVRTARWIVDGETGIHAVDDNPGDRVERSPGDREGDIHAVDDNGWTPLHCAAAADALDAARWLVDRGADIHAADDNGWTPLHVAAAAGAGNTPRWLVDRIADMRAAATEGHDAFCNTLLHLAASANDVDAMPLLVEQGADIHVMNNDGETPLYGAVQRGAMDAARWLAERGADIRGGALFGGGTLLHYAARRDDVEKVRWLIEQGADIRAVDNDGETPLHHAAGKDAVDAARQLVERGADVRAVNANGETPLDLATRKEADRAAEWLFQRRRRDPTVR